MNHRPPSPKITNKKSKILRTQNVWNENVTSNVFVLGFRIHKIHLQQRRKTR